MSTVKVSIQDENTLVLQEDAQKGDLIDLKSIHETDIDKSTIASVVSSIKNDEFNARLQKEIKSIEREKELEAQLKEQEIIDRSKDDISKKDQEIAALNSKLDATETEKQLAVTEALNKVEKERDELIAKLREKESEAKLIESQTKNVTQEDMSKKDSEITDLQAKLGAKETEKRLAVTEAINKIERERDELRSKLDKTATEKELAVNVAVNVIEKERDELANKIDLKDHEQKQMESSLKEKHEAELRLKDEQIAQYKDFKAKQSIKLLGENLEQHCEITFRQWQANGVFRNAYFAKDNDISLGGKGDYVYRETDEAGNEILSIMFDMKNEADDTIAKKRNEDYFKKLDKDRADKKCEYAVLVSVLEVDSELYAGITDVSYVYDKMYVVRPQFFIPIITILRNAALNSMKYKSELALVREQNIDITNFEGELQIFQEGFMKNVKDSGSKFQEAMDGIDATIKKLEGVKEALRLSNKHLLIAGNKVENVSVKRLTKNNPTMAEKFTDLKKDHADD